MKAKRARGFTLIELLVVIAIITVLIGILMPALGHATRLGRRTRCLANLEQIGKAVQMYVQNNSDRYPEMVAMRTVEEFVAGKDEEVEPRPSMPEVLGKEISDQTEIFHCPADEWIHGGESESEIDKYIAQQYLEKGYQSYFEGEGTSYEWWESYNNCKVGRALLTDPRKAGVHPSDAPPLVSDFEAFHGDPEDAGTWNVLFVDMHAEPDNWSERSAMMNPQPPPPPGP